MLSKLGVTRIMQNYPKVRVNYHLMVKTEYLPGNSHPYGRSGRFDSST